MSYTSSIMSKYGDVHSVRNDVKTLNEILSRQGNSLLIDTIAESAGRAANRFEMNSDDREKLMGSLTYELSQSLGERV